MAQLEQLAVVMALVHLLLLEVIIHLQLVDQVAVANKMVALQIKLVRQEHRVKEIVVEMVLVLALTLVAVEGVQVELELPQVQAVLVMVVLVLHLLLLEHLFTMRQVVVVALILELLEVAGQQAQVMEAVEQAQ